MSDVKILSEKPLSMAEVKEELDKIKKRDKELNFRANKTEDYINQFASNKNAAELSEKLTKLNIPRLKEHHIKKIVDIMPITTNDLKVVLQGYTVSINAENSKKIIEIINKFLEEKK